jgi:hypothetical protein
MSIVTTSISTAYVLVSKLAAVSIVGLGVVMMVMMPFSFS